MKKLNNKGVTLIELLVSFAIVSVAMVYFYQTMVDLSRMYKNTVISTDNFVNKSYALRLLDAYYVKTGGVNDFCRNYSDAFCVSEEIDESVPNYYIVGLKKNGATVATYYANKNAKVVQRENNAISELMGSIESYNDIDSIQGEVGKKLGKDYSAVESYDETTTTINLINSDRKIIKQLKSSAYNHSTVNALSTTSGENIIGKKDTLNGTKQYDFKPEEYGDSYTLYFIVNSNYNSTGNVKGDSCSVRVDYNDRSNGMKFYFTKNSLFDVGIDRYEKDKFIYESIGDGSYRVIVSGINKIKTISYYSEGKSLTQGNCSVLLEKVIKE